VKVYSLSSNAPATHAAWAKQLKANDQLGEQELLSDRNFEAARAFGILRDQLLSFRPLNTRGAFLVDGDGTVVYAWTTPGDNLSVLPDPEPVLAAARALQHP
jgi:alkyl hydroperoxide reductase subunit AhpC